MTRLIIKPERFGVLIHNDLLMTASARAVALGSALGVIFVLDVIAAGLRAEFSHRDVFTGLLVIGGFLLTSVSFADIHDPRRATHYLTLPGSMLEKYIARLLVTTVGWTVTVLVSYIAVSALGAGISQALFGRSIGIFLPVTSDGWKAVAEYLVANSIFIFGAIYFRKATFVKVVLAATILGIAFSLYLALVTRVVFIGHFSHFVPTQAELAATFGNNANISPELQRIATVTGKIFSWAVVPLFFWIMGYRRLRETEV